jgi:hypothetical protein
MKKEITTLVKQFKDKRCHLNDELFETLCDGDVLFRTIIYFNDKIELISCDLRYYDLDDFEDEMLDEIFEYLLSELNQLKVFYSKM